MRVDLDIIALAKKANILEDVELLSSNPWRQDKIRELHTFAQLIQQEYDAGFKEAVTDELVVCGIYTKEHDENPRKAVQDAILWNCSVALDPLVSKEASELKKSGVGLKNHHIAGLISAIAKEIETKFKTPQSTREVIRHVALDYLSDNGLMIDSAVKRYK